MADGFFTGTLCGRSVARGGREGREERCVGIGRKGLKWGGPGETEGKDEGRGTGCGGRRCSLFHVTCGVLRWFCLLVDVLALLSFVLNWLVGT